MGFGVNDRTRATLMLIASSVIFGTVGFFRNYIDLPSALLAMLRGFFGAVFLLLILSLRKSRLAFRAIRNNLWLLLAAGALMGLNWIFLFEAYRYTTVAKAELCNYTAPVIIILLSPVVLRESLSVKKAVCALVALSGMVLVSGVLDTGAGDGVDFRGILFGLGSALLYAAVVLLNKKLTDIGAWDRTIVQLFAAAIILLPYVLLAGDFSEFAPTPLTLGMTAVVCLFHTSVAYALYFGSARTLPAQTLALLSYITPVVAVIFSTVVLRESMSFSALIGAVLLIGSAAVGELPEKQKA